MLFRYVYEQLEIRVIRASVSPALFTSLTTTSFLTSELQRHKIWKSATAKEPKRFHFKSKRKTWTKLRRTYMRAWTVTPANRQKLTVSTEVLDLHCTPQKRYHVKISPSEHTSDLITTTILPQEMCSRVPHWYWKHWNKSYTSTLNGGKSQVN